MDPGFGFFPRFELQWHTVRFDAVRSRHHHFICARESCVLGRNRIRTRQLGFFSFSTTTLLRLFANGLRGFRLPPAVGGIISCRAFSLGLVPGGGLFATLSFPASLIRTHDLFARVPNDNSASGPSLPFDIPGEMPLKHMECRCANLSNRQFGPG